MEREIKKKSLLNSYLKASLKVKKHGVWEAYFILTKNHAQENSETQNNSYLLFF